MSRPVAFYYLLFSLFEKRRGYRKFRELPSKKKKKKRTALGVRHQSAFKVEEERRSHPFQNVDNE